MNSFRTPLPALLCGALLLAFGGARMEAQGPPSGAESPPLVFGMSTALSGPASDLGENMKAGVEAAFSEANAGGGVNGQKLRLIALDDGYEPGRTVPNMHRLILEKKVLGVVGNVGTPTAIAALPIAIENRTPFFGAFTGAGVLRRTPPDRYVINYRASYAEETEAMVDALVAQAGISPRRIAFFTQRDGYGDAGFAGGLAALRRHGVRNSNEVLHGRYERNTLAVEGGLAELLQEDPLPQAVILVGAYAPCAQFIRLARESDLDALFLNVSFVGAAPLMRALGTEGEGVIITQVVPHYESDLPLVRSFRRVIRELPSPTPATFGSLEGYIAGRILVKALRGVEGAIDREGVVRALEALGRFDIGLGMTLRLDADNHQASHRVWPTIIRKGRVLPFEWKEMASMVKRDAN